MRINNNIPALNTKNKLTINTKNSAVSLKKLSSGMRINTADDDAAGLAISEKMRGQIRGLVQAGRNVQDGISLIQTAEGGLANITESLQRMRELSVQAANGTLTSSDRQAVQAEINQSILQIDEIANNTEFNSIKVLNQPAEVPRETITQTVSATTNVTTSSQITPPTVNWTSKYNSNQLTHLAYNGSRFVAVGRDGDIAYSDNGINWSSSTSGLTTVFTDIAYANGKFVAVGNHGTIISSADGVTWDTGFTLTPPISNIADWSITSIAFNGTSFAATATDYAGSENFFISNDGVNWDVNVLPVPHSCGVMGSGSGLFITNMSGGIYTSSDGLTWANKGSLSSFGYSDVIEHIDYAGGKFFIVGRSSGHALVSDDLGANWTNVNITNRLESTLNEVVFNGYNYLAIGDIYADGTNRAKSYASVDGVNWTYQDVPDGNYLASVVWDGSKYVAVGLYRTVFGVPVDPTTIPEPPPVVNNSTNSVQTTNTVGNVKTTIRTDTNISDSVSTTHAHNGITSNHTTTTTVTTTTTTNTKNFVPNQDAIKNIQAGANAGNSFQISLADVRTASLGIANISVETTTNASNAIAILDTALGTVSSERSKFGAYQNALEHITTNVSNAELNLTAAESRIRDVDMAKEMMLFTKNNILMQATQSMLAQANQQPQGILQLLK